MIPDWKSGPDGPQTSSRVELVRRISFALCVAAALAWGVWLVGSMAGWWPADRSPGSDGRLLMRDAAPGLLHPVMENPGRFAAAVRMDEWHNVGCATRCTGLIVRSRRRRTW